jgi:hypothetical protein
LRCLFIRLPFSMTVEPFEQLHARSSFYSVLEHLIWIYNGLLIMIFSCSVQCTHLDATFAHCC